MKNKPYVVTEYYYPKSEHVDDVMNILTETSAMIKDQDGAMIITRLKNDTTKQNILIPPFRVVDLVRDSGGCF